MSKKELEYKDGENWNDRARRLGVYLGFPKCCIDEFLEECGNKGKRKLDGTGYVPCRICNEKSEQELIEAISIKRVCKDPFPTAFS